MSLFFDNFGVSQRGMSDIMELTINENDLRELQVYLREVDKEYSDEFCGDEADEEIMQMRMSV